MRDTMQNFLSPASDAQDRHYGITYYEVCLASGSPLAGSQTAECADLREALQNIFERRGTRSMEPATRLVQPIFGAAMLL